MPEQNIDLYSDDEDQDPGEGQNGDEEDPIQESDLSHFAAIYVLRRDNAYLLRELHLQNNRHLEVMKRIRHSTQLKVMELAKLRRSRIRKEKAEHARNRRQRDSILGNFHMFLKLTGQVEDVADDEIREDPLDALGHFWGLTEQLCGGERRKLNGSMDETWR